MSISYIFLFLTFLAEIIGTIGGFGSSVFFVPVANFYFSFEMALGMTALFHVASNLSKIVQFKKGLDRKLVIYLGGPAVIMVIVGGLLTNYFKTIYLEIFLGLALISLSLFFLIFKNYKIKAGKQQAIIGGSLSGLMAGLLGTGGAVRGLTMAAFNLEKNIFIATSAAIDFSVDLSRSFVYFYNGYITKEVLFYLPFLVFIGWFGTALGKILLKKISQEKFKLIALLLIFGIGLFTFWQAINNI